MGKEFYLSTHVFCIFQRRQVPLDGIRIFWFMWFEVDIVFVSFLISQSCPRKDPRRNDNLNQYLPLFIITMEGIGYAQ